MYKEDLLNKRDRLAYRIILDVYLQNGETTLAGISQRLQTPLSSVKRYLTGLGHDLAPWTSSREVRFEVNGTKVIFQLLGAVTIDELLVKQQLQTADNVVLLKFLYQHGLRFRAPQLMNVMHVSEASLYRKLKVLNALLAPFDLKVTNGQLVGDLSQLQFFYFNFWRTIGEHLPASDDFDLMRNWLTNEGFRLDDHLVDRLQDWLAIVQHSVNSQWSYRREAPLNSQRLMRHTSIFERLRKESEWPATKRQAMLLFILLHSEFMFTDQMWQCLLSTKETSIIRLVRLVTTCKQALRDAWLGVPLPGMLTEQRLAGIFIVPMVTVGDVQIFDDVSFHYFTKTFFRSTDRRAFDRVQYQLTHTKSVWINQFVRRHWPYIERRLWPYLVVQSRRVPLHVGLALGFSKTVTQFAKRALMDILTQTLAVTISDYQVGAAFDLVVVNERTAAMVSDRTGTPVEKITELGTERDYRRIARRLKELLEKRD
ncbi:MULTISPECIES: helix-turn-helix domain-containing protein [Furfurilactobacillus]|uniref:Mga helix-turn-helix domain-containing protein n=1 Tax=Furfurilactobacillus rossiae TaxID=231049 RepID=A0A7C9J2P8_9LACO|nr:helix-turn-helix domain-containing protein [Furfurilactobacillus milii]MYV06135.1 hypothetical protein [Furfurilactobacillus milii]